MTSNDQLKLDVRPGETIVGQVLDRIRRESRDLSEQGRWFENLVARVLRDNRDYEIKEVYRWAEWPQREELTGLDGRDLGIDLVALSNDDRWIPIQCKFYQEDASVGKAEIDSFIAVTQRSPFSMRWSVMTCRWTSNAEAQIEGMSPPLRRIDFLRHVNDPITEEGVERPIREPWPLQDQAIEDVTTGLLNNQRGRLVMACGTGKTFASLRIAERIVPDGGRILFLTPSIALVSQARREWLRHTARDLECRVVCSDSSAGGRGESEDIKISELECAVTSAPAEIADLLSGENRKTRVIFCTYQSLRQITEAQFNLGAPAFDLTIADEAHRTTGVEKSASGFQAVHKDHQLKTTKRLYMTATPRIYTEASRSRLQSRDIKTIDMSDLDEYGPELHRLTFMKAVNAEMLSDYRVIALGVHENAVSPSLRNTLVSISEEMSPRQRSAPLVFNAEDAVRLMGTSLAINGVTEGDEMDKPGRLLRTIGFANSIARSRFYARVMNLPQLRSATTRHIRSNVDAEAESAMQLEVEHLDASHSAFKRNQALRKLDNAARDGVARLICNVRLFGEGVDVPSLDAIAFMQPRESQIDIVQAVGRVMRRSEGKRFGYIIVPISIAPGSNIESALAEGTSGYQALGKVLRALQSHDGRLAEDPLRFVQVSPSW